MLFITFSTKLSTYGSRSRIKGRLWISDVPMFHDLPREIMKYNFPREIISRLVRILLLGMVSDKTPALWCWDWDIIPSQGSGREGSQVSSLGGDDPMVGGYDPIIGGGVDFYGASGNNHCLYSKKCKKSQKFIAARWMSEIRCISVDAFFCNIWEKVTPRLHKIRKRQSDAQHKKIMF